MSVTLTVMGCGNSEGTPRIGNDWGVCDPNEPKNRRTRPSVVVQSENTALVIDTGPDFREQINKHNVRHIDAVLYTHAHGDHVNGIDELRVLAKQRKGTVDIYALEESLDELKRRFDYYFIEKSKFYPVVLNAMAISGFNQEMTIGDITFIPFLQDHGTCNSLGFRFGDIAYSTDVVDLSEASIETLKGVKIWVVDGAGYKWPESPVHMNLEGIYRYNERIGAEKVYITHLSCHMDYQTLLAETPEGYEPAYDGLQLKCL